jgi:hypothetical protein
MLDDLHPYTVSAVVNTDTGEPVGTPIVRAGYEDYDRFSTVNPLAANEQFRWVHVRAPNEAAAAATTALTADLRPGGDLSRPVARCRRYPCCWSSPSCRCASPTGGAASATPGIDATAKTMPTTNARLMGEFEHLRRREGNPWSSLQGVRRPGAPARNNRNAFAIVNVRIPYQLSRGGTTGSAH